MARCDPGAFRARGAPTFAPVISSPTDFTSPAHLESKQCSPGRRGTSTAGLPAALQGPTPMDGVKLYVHYDNAWWLNLLNLFHLINSTMTASATYICI